MEACYSTMVATDKKDTLIFQDVVKDEEKRDDEALSLAFFELANVAHVGYRLQASQRRRRRSEKDDSTVITVEQDTTACGNHTGGIVWETSYLLLNYLSQKREKLGRVLEVGAGCGLLGQVLAASGWCKQVVLTETKEVLVNLNSNLERNAPLFLSAGKKKKKHRSVISAQQLDWLAYEKDTIEDLKKASFDTIVGTDVVFSPSLVEPLLSTLTFMASKVSVVYLCLQIRCEDSHKLLLEKAKSHGWKLNNISEELASTPGCAWGVQMECHLIQLTRIPQDDDEAVMDAKKKKKRKAASNNQDDGNSSSKKRK
jgi:predicted nicotinamide N-methyase